jgi:hypothetical protein
LDLAREKQPLKLTQTKMFPYASGIGEQWTKKLQLKERSQRQALSLVHP